MHSNQCAAMYVKCVSVNSTTLKKMVLISQTQECLNYQYTLTDQNGYVWRAYYKLYFSTHIIITLLRV